MNARRWYQTDKKFLVNVGMVGVVAALAFIGPFNVLVLGAMAVIGEAFYQERGRHFWEMARVASEGSDRWGTAVNELLRMQAEVGNTVKRGAN